VCCRIHQHGAIVDDRVAIVGHAILARHVVIGDAARRQILADPDLTVIAIGRNVAFRNVAAKARP
jgi:hypothetical protein